MYQRLLLLAGLFLFLSNSAEAQKTITGRVMDAATGEPLPAAHVIIKGTYKGTIANADGEYSIKVDSLPATIVARFLGFESMERTVDASFEGDLDFPLKEAYLEMEEIVVTGEDPAISIMKEVIRRKQIWRENLNTYEVDAYTRQRILKDTTIIMISESISEAYWDKKRGNREILKSRRQTANIEGSDNFAGVSYLPNFYDDNLDIVDFDVVGITHPDALKYYHFELVDYSKIDDQIVFEIKVSSKRKLQPLFEGTIHVLDQQYALLDVKLKPNSVVVFPPPIREFDMYYEQQFSTFGGDYWLPVDFRMEGSVKIGVPGLNFPPIGFSQVSKLNDYKVNIDLPDTLFKRDWMTVDSTTIDRPDSMFVTNVDVIPLSSDEERAYENIDSTTSLEKEFRPTGFLARFIDFDDEDENVGSSTEGVAIVKAKKNSSAFRKFIKDFKLDGRYNRVDAVYAGLNYERRFVDRRIQGKGSFGFSTGYEEFNHAAEIAWWPLAKTRRFLVRAGYRFDTDTRYTSNQFKRTITSLLPLMGYADYFDYYRNEGFYVGTAYRTRRILGNARNLYLTYHYENHSSIDFKTSYDIFARSNIQRFNPPVNEGTLSSLELSMKSGGGKEALGVIGADDIFWSIEHSAGYMGSDWDFTRFEVDIFRRYDTFFQRRLIPNALDLRLNAGTYLGDLPVQKNGMLDVAFGYFTPFGSFKSKQYIPYEGASYVALNAEHNFRSVPFEMLGWRSAPKTGLSIIVFGGIGKTWIPQKQKDFFQSNLGYLPVTTKDWHSEVGISLSNIFSLFRVDLAYRIDEPGFYPGISLARFF